MARIVEIKIIDDIKYKECVKCKEWKSFDEYYKSNTDKTGKHANCKDCYKQYYIDNYDKLKEYRDERKEIKCDYAKNYNKNNKEQYTKYQKKYQKENRDKINENIRDRYCKDDSFRLYILLRAKNRDGLKRAIKYYLEGKTDKLPSKSPSRLLLKLYKIQNHVCPYCSSDMRDNIHIDHIVPLSKNGSNDVENLILCCSTCNLSKSAKNLEDWLKECNIDYNSFIGSIEERNRLHFSEEIISA